MKYLFSSTTIGFYIADLSAKIPDGSVEITEEQYIEFAGVSWPDGKVLGSDDNGNPAWLDAPPQSDEELIAIAEGQKAQLRIIAADEIAWRQDAVDAGIATEEETAALAEWKKYRVLLMRVDTSDPEWPTPPATQAS
ncbi:tail fiber assembly protein [Enterobacter ludwigii]|uniref:tail fiber assembly protein n=1 Tax=Enterobacter ludwigii TaxID=299767 RepID=UPI001BACA5B6|nr:tail fiber assembly protein [Enterobacter ludwigii]HDT6026047.1 tail fiber assembly protein [Enterobacter cloacae subsp. cloacae]HEB4092685.1 tail fiber assembly protein [Enterobacter cloacae]MBS0870139.1 tail fiber assembly protein [Enterobacter ludwigii]HDR2684757.1 tail fiber assembly protein [Enterobacter ludwigii]HDT6092482.1 tail fiber assembly protein [Enterobacter cloacae subsp. cloacae]